MFRGGLPRILFSRLVCGGCRGWNGGVRGLGGGLHGLGGGCGIEVVVVQKKRKKEKGKVENI